MARRSVDPYVSRLTEIYLESSFGPQEDVVEQVQGDAIPEDTLRRLSMLYLGMPEEPEPAPQMLGLGSQPAPPPQPATPPAAPLPSRPVSGAAPMPSEVAPTPPQFAGADQIDDKVRSGLGPYGALAGPQGTKTAEAYQGGRGALQTAWRLAKDVGANLSEGAREQILSLGQGAEALSGALMEHQGPLRPFATAAGLATGAVGDVLTRLPGTAPPEQPQILRPGEMSVPGVIGGAIRAVPQLAGMAAAPQTAMAQVMLQAFGAKHNELRQQGVPEDEARLNAAATAVATTAIEFINRIPGIEKAASSEPVKRTAKQIVGAVLKNAGLEAAEEGLQNVADDAISVAFDHGEGVDWREALYSSLVGGTIGLVAGGGSVAGEQRAANQIEAAKQRAEVRKQEAAAMAAEAQAERQGEAPAPAQAEAVPGFFTGPIEGVEAELARQAAAEAAPTEEVVQDVAEAEPAAGEAVSPGGEAGDVAPPAPKRRGGRRRKAAVPGSDVEGGDVAGPGAEADSAVPGEVVEPPPLTPAPEAGDTQASPEGTPRPPAEVEAAEATPSPSEEAEAASALPEAVEEEADPEEVKAALKRLRLLRNPDTGDYRVIQPKKGLDAPVLRDAARQKVVELTAEIEAMEERGAVPEAIEEANRKLNAWVDLETANLPAKTEPAVVEPTPAPAPEPAVQAVQREVAIEPKRGGRGVDAYREQRTSDPETGELGTTRTEYRIRRATDKDREKVYQESGARSIIVEHSHSRPWVLEERTIRDGKEQARVIFDFYKSEKEAAGDLPQYLTPQSQRAKAEYDRRESDKIQRAKEEQERAAQEAEDEAKLRHRKASESAYRRVVNNPKNAELKSALEEAGKRASALSEGEKKALVSMPEYQSLRDDVLRATTIPAKAKALRALVRGLPALEAKATNQPPPPKPAAKKPKGKGKASPARPASAVETPARPVEPGSPAPEAYAGVEVEVRRALPGEKVEPKGTLDLTRDVAKIWKIPVRYRFFRAGRPARGVYKILERVVRLRHPGDIGTLAHEVGHHIYSLGRDFIRQQPAAILDEMRAKGRELYANEPDVDKLSDETLAMEGFSEAIFHQWARKDPAAHSQILHDWIRNEFLPAHPEIARNFAATAMAYDAFRRAPSRARLEGALDTQGRLSRKAKSPAEWLTGVLHDHLRHWWDRWSPVQYAEEAAMSASGIVDAEKIQSSRRPSVILAVYDGAEQSIVHYMMEEQLKSHFDGKTAQEVRDQVAFAYAQAFVELADPNRTNAEGEVVGPLQTPASREDAIETMRELDSPAHRAFADAVQSYSNALVDYAVEAGALTPEAGDRIKSSHAHYMPMMRVFDESFKEYQQARGRGMADQSPIMRRRRGSQRPVQDLLVQLTNMGVSTVRQANLGRAGAALGELVTSLSGDQSMAGLIEEISLPPQLQSLAVSQVEAQLLELGVDEETLKENRDTILNYWVQQRNHKGQAPVVSVVVGGKLRHFWIGDPILYESLLGGERTPPEAVIPATLWAIGRGMKKGVTGGATSLNPGFSLVTNPIRDILFGMLRTQRKYAIGHLFGTLKWTVKQFDRNDPIFKMWRSMGGELSTVVGEVFDDYGRSLYREFGTKPENWRDYARQLGKFKELYRSYIGATENAARLSEFEAVYNQRKAAGDTEYDARLMAAYRAAEITINFRRGGTSARFWNQVAPFFNVSFQGLRALKTTFEGKRPGEMIDKRAVVRGISALMLPALALWWKNKDEEWYKELPAFERMAYVHVKATDDEIVRIPLPFEAGFAFATLPTALIDSFYRRTKTDGSFDWKFFGKMLGQVGRSMTPGTLPTAASLLYETMTGIDTMTGRPIESMRIASRRETERYYDTTPGFYRRMSKIVDAVSRGEVQISPVKLQNIVEGVTGGMARGMMPRGESKEAADLPIVGRLFSRRGRPALSVEFMYDESERLGEVMASIKALQQEGKKAEAEDLERRYAEDLGLRREISGPMRYARYVRIRKAREQVQELARERGRDRAFYEKSAQIAREVLGYQ